MRNVTGVKMDWRHRLWHSRSFNHVKVACMTVLTIMRVKSVQETPKKNVD